VTTDLPTIALLATGGTIAGSAAAATDTTGYVAGALGADALLAAVPAITTVARIRAQQVYGIDSKDITGAHWLTLARAAQAALDDATVAGVVITHGTDTLEESAIFLDRTLDCRRKPVVLTGAMRPATALSADGPMNLYDAVCAAADPDSAGRGVLVCFNRLLFGGATVHKQHTSSLDAFGAREGGPEGHAGPVRYPAAPSPRPIPQALPVDAASLPRIDILHVGAGMSADMLECAVQRGARGVILALPGNGSLPQLWHAPVAQAVAAGVRVVRASRCGNGNVTAHHIDQQCGSTAAGALSPAAARIALMLDLLTAHG
jgi:L-asparaginase